MSATVWTTSRKWTGNAIPAAVWFVITAIGIREILVTHEFGGRGLWLLILADAFGWVFLNQFGLYQNSRMKRRLTAILGKSGNFPDDRVFVGFSSPKYNGVLDAHEDVGFLCFTLDEIVFTSETRTIRLSRSEIERVVFRPNIHSMVGLGRWISIEGSRSRMPIRMLIEPRTKRTMLGNLLDGKKLKKKITEWRDGNSSL